MDTPLKQRLIGAIVLVALAVIFLPMLVKGPAPDSGVASVPIAAPDAPADGQFETRELPLVAPAGGATGLQTGQAKPLQETAAPATPPTVDTSPAVAAGNFAVTFGAYGSKADADAVIAYLQRSQLPGFAETTTISGRQAWRVRVGPYADRAQAEAARLQAVKIRAEGARVLGHLVEVVTSTSRDRLQPDAIHGDLDLMRVLHTAHQVERVPPQAKLDDVLGVHGERVLDQEATARAWRHSVDMLILREVRPDAIRRGARRERRIPERHPADVPRCREVALHQRR